ncbi:MAG: DNA cytosine methyltransferase [Thermogemmatispora sp.]|jgi:DNA (cytosine-5)-methyltransferase 1|uniref:DNA cytosine methyltransferase n=1 Tax=Thermogemmatispora sp. TaxID=1968838 RepID=UPI001A03E206|nr:DNA cytosine methyltransferase [Thermogemmatispora sp.]MBE3567944.1 DNA cytosine methyltransferase [Thermogemmatispora sp.]
MKEKPIVLDLFCGAGGLSLGFEMAGYQIGLGIEKEVLPYRTHRLNFGDACYLGDICLITDPVRFIQERNLERVDVIIGGPPCQGFSRVGRGKLRRLHKDPGYIHDPRNQYYQEFIRFIRVLQPLYFVMENVPDMQYYHDGEELLLEKASRSFREMGYVVDFRILQAADYGVPQTRKRLFMIGNRLGHGIRWPPQTHRQHPVTVWQAISDLPIVPHRHRLDVMPYEPRGELTSYQRQMREGAGDLLYNHQTRAHNEQDLAAFALLPEGGKYVDLPAEYKRYRDDIFKDKYRKLFRDRPCWTIEAHIGKDSYRYIYPSRQGEPEPPRTISVREAARLQSFPDRFRFAGPFTRQFSQLGNAVPPLLARAVAEAIRPGVLAGISSERKEASLPSILPVR